MRGASVCGMQEDTRGMKYYTIYRFDQAGNSEQEADAELACRLPFALTSLPLLGDSCADDDWRS